MLAALSAVGNESPSEIASAAEERARAAEAADDAAAVAAYGASSDDDALLRQRKQRQLGAERGRAEAELKLQQRAAAGSKELEEEAGLLESLTDIEVI